MDKWLVDPRRCVVSNGDTEIRLEPKTMDLLCCLATAPGDVFTRDELLAEVWPDITVSDDALARSVSKLRKVLNDDPRMPRIIETISKRGYRLLLRPTIAESTVNMVSDATPPSPPSINQFRRSIIIPVLGGAVLLTTLLLWHLQNHRQSASANKTATEKWVEQADDFYFQYTRTDNESAIKLYENAIAAEPKNALAHAGLANALVQRVIRWPNPPDQPEIQHANLQDALHSGRTTTPQAQQQLQRALALAERAVRLDANNPNAHKALGFVFSAQKQFDEAIAAYQQAITIDPDAWGSMINIGDILEITGKSTEALPYFEQAYAAMTRVYTSQATRVRPWYAELGVAIGERYLSQQKPQEAEVWFRQVLSYSPLHKRANLALADVLSRNGDKVSARQLCDNLIVHTGPVEECSTY